MIINRGNIIDNNCCTPVSQSDCYKPCAHKHDDLYYDKRKIDLMLKELNLSAGAKMFFGQEVPTGQGKIGDVYFLITEELTTIYQKEPEWVVKGKIVNTKIKDRENKQYNKGDIVVFNYKGIQHLFRALVITTEPPANDIEIDPDWEILGWDVQLETRLSTRIDAINEKLNLIAGEGLYYDEEGKLNLGAFLGQTNKGLLTKPVYITNFKTPIDPYYIFALNEITGGIGIEALAAPFNSLNPGSRVQVIPELIYLSNNIAYTDDNDATVSKNASVGLENGTAILNASDKIALQAPLVEYGEDQSANYTSRSLVDKAYVDSKQVLVRITEGVNTGQRLLGYDTTYFGDIGNNAVDFTTQYTLPNSAPFLHLQSYITGGLMGATGRFAFSAGGANVASGNQAFACGLGNIATAGSTFVSGQGNQATGLVAAAFGDNTSAIGAKSFVTGSVNVVTGSASGAYSGYNNQVSGVNSASIAGQNNFVLSNGSVLGASTASTANANFSSLFSTANCQVLGAGSSIIASGASKTTGIQTAVIASQSSEISENIYFGTILASNLCKIVKADGTIGGRNQAIIASDTSTINVGQGSTYEKWNNAIIAAYYAKINAGMSYNLVTGQGTIGTASAQLVIGMFNEDEPHLSVNNPLKKAFIIGGGGNSMVTGGDPALEDRKTVFYVQHNGDMVNTGTIKTTQYKLSALNTAPASATATGVLGETRITADYIYVCTATNVWKRAALTTW